MDPLVKTKLLQILIRDRNNQITIYEHMMSNPLEYPLGQNNRQSAEVKQVELIYMAVERL